MTTPTEELLARVQEYLSLGGLFNPEAMHPQDAVRNLIIDLAALIREQAAQLETERKAREEAERGSYLEYEDLCKTKQRCAETESRLAAVFEKTRERCAKVCQKVSGLEGNQFDASYFGQCAKAIRALAPTDEQAKESAAPTPDPAILGLERAAEICAASERSWIGYLNTANPRASERTLQAYITRSKEAADLADSIRAEIERLRAA